MLANGIKLGFKKTDSESTYTYFTDMKEVPELGVDPEKVENSALLDKVKKYEFGIGDPGDMAYKFRYENGSASSDYRVMNELAEKNTPTKFQELFPDGTSFEFEAFVSVKTGGGAVNGAIEFTANMALQSDITVTNPVVA